MVLFARASSRSLWLNEIVNVTRSVLSVWFVVVVVVISVGFHIFLHTVQVKLSSTADNGGHDRQQQSRLVDTSRYLPEEVLGG